MYTRLPNLRQGSRTVDEYAEEFYMLMTRNEIHDSEIQSVARFIGGLKTQLQNALAQFDPNTVAEGRRRAVSFEQQFRGSSSNWNASIKFRNSSLQDQNAAQGLLPENTDLIEHQQQQRIKLFVVLHVRQHIVVSLVVNQVTGKLNVQTN